MAGGTAERIMEHALELFSKNGYQGTSMSDIAARLGITKGALYRHYAGKRDILDSIVRRMYELDAERAREHGMPEELPDGASGACGQSLREYSKAQFRYWTEEPFPSAFRRMLTLEQYRDGEMARLYQQLLASGPLEYVTALLRTQKKTEGQARALAMALYGPMFLMYSVYDGAEDKNAVLAALDEHIDRAAAACFGE